jgi:hypothetical protein
MALTRRGTIVAGAATALLLAAGAIGYFALFPQKAPAIVRTTLATVGLADEPPPPPPTCPLTGLEPTGGKVPHRPALAVKVENHPAARPQAALNEADVVYEEPVEGGYTRFIAVFQCEEADRVGPVRSGRLTDPDVLRQFGPAVFGYAGGVAAVKREVPRAGLVDVNYILAADAYVRDPAKASPHDVYTTTSALRKAAASDAGPPRPVFSYADAYEGTARRASGVHLPFSTVSDVVWTWDRREGAWLRAHGEVAHLLEDGSQVSARTVVVQVVEVAASHIVDAAGNPSPDVELTGRGRAYVFRDGTVIVGRWERPTLEDVTRFLARDGEEIPLSPGRTWVELLPSTVPVEILR